MNASALRSDLAVVRDWIAPHSRVLDLGCGDGTLLAHLAAERGVTALGVEIDPKAVQQCIARGVDVLQLDIDGGLKLFGDRSFDYVVLSQAIQMLRRPDRALEEMLRIGRRVIVTFPNFAHWRVRLALLAGRMPVTATLPKAWYSTDNIHLCTVADFDALIRERGWRCHDRRVVDSRHRDRLRHRLWPNLFGEIATYLLSAPDGRPPAA